MTNFESPYRFIPNVLTISRVAIAAYYPFAPFSLRLWLIFAVLFTHIDIFLVLTLNWHSKFGKSLGPIADKLLMISVAVTTYYTSEIELWKFLLLVSKDIVVMSAALFLIAKHGVEILHHIPYRRLGTMTIALQLALFINYLQSGYLNANLLYIAMAISTLSALDYANHMRKGDFVQMNKDNTSMA
jgi:cardiolipin synthase